MFTGARPVQGSPRFLAAAALAMCALTQAAAGQTYFYSGSVTETVNGVTQYNDPYQGNLPGQLGSSRYLFPPEAIATTSMRAQSGAGPGFIVASAFTQLIKNTINDGAFTVQIGGLAFAKTIWTDVEASGTPGMVPTRVRLHLTGSTSAGTSINPRAISTVQLLIRINGQNVGSGSRTISVIGGSTTVFESGLLTNFSGNAVIESNPIMVAANTPFEVEVQLTASASTQLFWGFSGNGSALTDFSHTLTFATDRPVFSVPAGYTVNSAQARIVDNTFTLPCPADLFHDTLVDDQDFSEFAAAYNILDCADPTMPPGCAADLNHDGVVDDADFSIFVVAYDAVLCE
ncbi:MAG TPA: hypothetical protein VK176_03270 [Phycisphaerales bacterium]|nr:hypothetical protein [Phycisphaerales bacterium]